jgi:serine protease
MKRIAAGTTRTWLGLLLLLAAGCGAPPEEPGTKTPQAAEPSLEEAERSLEEAAREERRAAAGLSFEEFKQGVFKEPFEHGKFIVNGDTSIADEKRLQEFFETKIKVDPDRQKIELVVHQVGGLDAIWNSQQRQNLTYCVSSAFGDRHDAVVAAMDAASGAWEAVAAVTLRHDPTQDATCGPANGNVVFDVRPVDVSGRYLARAFFPDEPRTARNVLIDESCFELDPIGKLQIDGILRHELGHVLGFRHEHTRPDSGACFEDESWRPITKYDALSVMHYPQCNGRGDWTLTLTSNDKNGAACLYGAAPSFSIDTRICQPTVVTGGGAGQAREQSFPNQSVALHEEKSHGSFAVVPGSVFEARIGGQNASGDPDLYVRFGQAPSKLSHDCRPYLLGPVETCSVDVPAGQSLAFVMVRGYSPGTYDLEVRHVAPGP